MVKCCPVNVDGCERQLIYFFTKEKSGKVVTTSFPPYINDRIAVFIIFLKIKGKQISV